MRQAGEPSVEEILSSIKKVIARDSRIESGRIESGRSEAGRRDGGGRGGDVLDLGEVAAQVLGAERKAPVRGSVPADDRAFDDEEEEGGDSPLLNDVTTSAMRDSLAALAMLAEPGARPQIVRAGETSLEGLVRELLRPMLAAWLDTHLPPMVERLVAAEIARIVRKKG
jgi:uncharacterized protein